MIEYIIIGLLILVIILLIILLVRKNNNIELIDRLNNLEKMLSTQSEVQKVSEKLHSGMDKAKDFKKIFVLFTDSIFEIDGERIVKNELAEEELHLLEKDFKKIVKNIRR